MLHARLELHICRFTFFMYIICEKIPHFIIHFELR